MPRPEWPPLTSLMAREAGRGVLTVLRFAQPIGAHVVLTELARQAVPGVDTGHGGVVVAYAGREPAAGLDVRAQRFDDARGGRPTTEIVVPADVVVSRARAPTRRSTPSSTARRPSSPTPASSRSTRWWSTPAAGARSGPSRSATSPPTSAVTEAAISALRDVQGLRVDLATADPQTVAHLAAAGVPLLATGTHPALGATPAAAHWQRSPTSTTPSPARSTASPTRRAALLEHSTVAWRGRLARRAPACGTSRGRRSACC